MKELSIEEKAKRYDEAIKKLRSLHEDYDTVSTLIDVKEELEDIFPELAESKDERMIQYFKDLAPFDKADELYEKYGFSHKDAIAWLEKQGENISLPKFTFDDVLALQCCMETVKKVQEDKELYEQLQSLHDRLHDAYWLEKQCEQKPTKVEPKYAEIVKTKFKDGDWVVYQNETFQVRSLSNGSLILQGKKYQTYFIAELCRPWTIQDAKDGDVLVASDGSIFLFKETVDNACKHYVAFTAYHDVKFNEGLEHYWETIMAVHPATKEQRDLLFQGIKEEGYEWDAEKKELKKIEKNPAWSEEDESKRKLCFYYLTAQKNYQTAVGIDYINGCLDWLDSIKERVLPQPQKEWSEEDEHHKRQILRILKDNRCSQTLQEKTEKWIEERLKSLRPQSTWKPSDAQMVVLNDIIINGHLSNANERILKSLQEQLKKLREE